jgi:subtilisin-like proprotein convertase family protein
MNANNKVLEKQFMRNFTLLPGVLIVMMGMLATGLQAATFANTNAITVPSSGPASPYPSTIVVAGLTGEVVRVVVTVSNISHTFPDDLDVLLTGPGGQNVLLISDAGGGNDVTNVTLTFSDASSNSVSDSGQIVSGTYDPTNYIGADPFTNPAPAGPYGAALAVFNGTNPNGAWNLFVFDDTTGDTGRISGGWSLTITATNSPPNITNQPQTQTVPCGGNATFTIGAQGTPPLSYQWRRNGSDLLGGTTTIYTVVPVSAADAGQYSVRVSNVGGSVTSSVAVLTVSDTNPPSIVCPTNFTVECGTPWTFGNPAASDGCAGTNVSIVIVDTITNADCGKTFSATRTWRATDSFSNAAPCSQTVTVVDTTPPVIGFLSDRTVQCGTPWTFITPGALPSPCDTSVSIQIVSTVTNASCGKTLTAIRIWRATDACGNSATCTNTVTVIDTTAPTIACAPNVTVECGTPWTFSPPAVPFDACDNNVSLQIISTITNLGCGNTLAATRFWQATDACGNSAICSNTVTVVDTTAPTLDCPADFTVDSYTAWSFGNPTASDACDGNTPTITVLSTVTNAGCGKSIIATRTWTASDSCGNTRTCAQTVKVDPCDGARYFDGISYSYAICNVPDIDQQRLGLINDGKLFCVPTSAMNWMAYIASHGVPELLPGPGDWSLSPPDPSYELMTFEIQFMGILMGTGTDPDEGTHFDDGLDGISSWFESSGVADLFIPMLRMADDEETPQLVDLAVMGKIGWLVMPQIGWYKPNDDGELERDGGHSVCLVEAERMANGPQYMKISDPDRGGSLTTQSPFKRDCYNVSTVLKVFEGDLRTASKVEGYDTGYIDGFYVIAPAAIFTGEAAGGISQSSAGLSGGTEPPEVVTRNFSTSGGQVSDLVIHPTGRLCSYLINGQDAVYQLDAVTGQSRKILDISAPKRVAAGGRKSNLFVLAASSVARVGNNGQVLNTNTLPAAFDAIAYDEKRQRLAGLSLSRLALGFFDEKLQVTEELALPPIQTNRLSAGLVSFVADGEGNVFWVFAEGSGSISRVDLRRRGRVEVSEISLAQVPGAKSVTVTDSGSFFVSDGERITVLDPTGRRILSLFNGTHCGDRLQFARRFSNVDPDVFVGPAYRNVLPTDVDATAPPPRLSIALSPSNQVVLAGDRASFKVTGAGPRPFTYQWFKNNAPLAGATNAIYVAPAASLADSGSLFKVTVSHGTGSVTSASALLSVRTTDTNSPVIFCPSNLVIECRSPEGSRGFFHPRVADDIDKEVTLVCSPPVRAWHHHSHVHCGG